MGVESDPVPRKRSLMLAFLKSFYIPLLEYCWKLRNPWKGKVIRAIRMTWNTVWYRLRLMDPTVCPTTTTIEYPTNINIDQSPQENGITVFGSRLYDLLPKYLRDMRSDVTDFF